jgi:outer membrane protein OmpA-like peptidoglycan-associated protein
MARHLVRFAAAAFIIAAPAMAEETPTVADHLCTFAGQCGGAKADSAASRDVGETKGFRVARPTSTAANPAKVQAAALAARAPERSLSAPSRGTGRAALAPAGERRGNLSIAFNLGSAEMTPIGVTAARNFATAIQDPALAGARFAIEGHTDSLGTAAANNELSQRRAQAVADYLVAQGVSASRLQVMGYGSAKPIKGTSQANPANRRVEALLLR